MFKFLHAADIHLDSALQGLERYQGAPVEEIRSATRRAFDRLVDLAVGEPVSFVLLAGDLYDGDWKDYNTGLFLAKRMGRLRSAGIPVFIVSGNHDAASQITSHLRLPDNVKTFSTQEPEQAIMENLGVGIYGQGFASRAVTQDLTQAYPQGHSHLFNIGLLHTCLDGKPGHEPYAPCSVDGLRSKGYQYWALGHVHAREEICRDPWILFSGNIQGRHVRETGPKGATLVTVEGDEVSKVEHRDLDVLRWSRCSVDLREGDTVDDVYEQVREALQQALDMGEGRPVAARILLRGVCRSHSRLHAEFEYWTQEFRALATGLGGSGVWLEKLVLATRQPAANEVRAAKDDALSGLLKAIKDLEKEGSVPPEILDEMAVLRQRLPPELLIGDDPFDPRDGVKQGGVLEDVKELLTTRLLAKGRD
jgi:DNA repair exonuclease SbcCD nuclease subunit